MRRLGVFVVCAALAIAGRCIVSSARGVSLLTGPVPDTAVEPAGAARLVRDAGLDIDAGELPTYGLRAVVMDVDADGDSDLITNPGPLEVDVWLNDGSGHLTRVHPAPVDTGWRPLPAGPRVGAMLHEQTAVSPDAPTGRHELAGAGPVAAATALARSNDSLLPSADVAAPGGPRAPPLA